MKPHSTRERRVIPVLRSPHDGRGRSALTCRYRCGAACFHQVPNTSNNSYLGDVVTGLSRRSLLRAAAVLSISTLTFRAVAGTAAATEGEKLPANASPSGLGFAPVAANTSDDVVAPADYEYDVVIRWGDPVLAHAETFDPDNQSAFRQATQFGYNCDYLALLDLPEEPHRVVLIANHEYTNEELMFGGYDPVQPTQDQVHIAWAAHGLSVVVFDEDNAGGLSRTPVHRLNRRITLATPMELHGPAAGSQFLRTSADPNGQVVLGTLNNCGGGILPWGTILSGEENFNQYFANADLVDDPITKSRLTRYGITGMASDRKWERFDIRFDISLEPNEVNRFGWVIEIDPMDPDFVPRKRTALGRFKHEAAEPRLTRDGRVALYMGDDERFDYLYKYVSHNSVRQGVATADRRHNLTLLDEGTLYVATFAGNSLENELDGSGALPSDGAFDGTGEWVALASGRQSFVEGMTAEEVYVYTRLAADQVGATKMDRPEDVEPHPQTGVVYIALTNNSDRGMSGKPALDEANPVSRNRHGHVIELLEKENDSASLTFTWRLFLVCGDPENPQTYFAGFPKEQVSPISCPDNLAFDNYGNLWLATDGNALGSNDGLFAVATQGPYRGQVKQFLTVPVGAETTGPILDDRRVIVGVQHPGEVDGTSADQPASTWPDGRGTIPRPSVIAVRHIRGKGIGAS